MSEDNKRSYFRIRDRVALKLSVIPAGSSRSLANMFEDNRRQSGLAAQFMRETELHRPNLKSIERSYPDIASYIADLESKIQRLAQHSESETLELPNKPSHTIDLSASGLALETENPIPVDSMVEIQMRLYPCAAVVCMFGIVVRIETVKGLNNKDIPQMGIRFTHIHDDDEELLIRHIHQVQLDALKVVVN